ncbi:cell envelope-related function transcriptional attenuator common domain-containing protein [Streptomyces sp. 3213]|uniref:LCP family protein n=1 Tax=Streptomyces sp. 3213.3 TaxID=1855348 RepID=UPI00089A99C3|nr:LCP family protein [Streptomyces sp. 3213.3]SED73050.1 cell envelope-related function transcriptional attenuator common domain-containing protein [Streptomyces sp. 3213] [Streptomyces sp. 3213.3]
MFDDTVGGVLGPGAGASASGAGLIRRRRRRWVRWSAAGVAALVVAAAGAGWAVYAKLDGNITPDNAAAAELARYEKERPTALVKGAQNILLIGSDSRSGDGNAEYGRDSGTERSDTTILLHLAADRRSATAVSLPRDLMVDVPGCLRPDGTRTEPMFAMFNYAFQVGGSGCTIRTVEKLTDVRIDHHMVVDFHGFKDMVDAVDGVDVCLKAPIRDKAAKLRLPAGQVTLDGEQALGYVRARKSLGNGSDTDRMDRQQRFLGALVNKVQSDDVLFNPAKLYPVLDAATSSLTTDPELASLRGLYELVRGVRDIPTEHVQFLTVPRESYIYNANRDQLVEPEAEKLFARIRTDAAVAVAGEVPEVPRDSGANTLIPAAGSGATPAPTFRGNTAAEDGCG